MNNVESLAAFCGIELSFEDARGETQHASPESIKKILAAMNEDVRSESQAGAVLAERQAADWRRILAPVRVCDLTQGAPQVEITLAGQRGRLNWTLQLENGETTHGRVAFDDLRLIGRRTIDGEELERRALALSPSMPLGYHRFSLDAPASSMSLIVSPGRCYLPTAFARGRRWWGISTQLYALRSKGNWGIGDFSDLRQLLEITRGLGGDVVGVNPLHALFLNDPSQASPYSPLSRLLLNVLNIDVARVPELVHSEKAQDLIASPAFQQQLQACRASATVNYEEVMQLKRPVLRDLYQTFQRRADPARGAAFDVFRSAQPEEFLHACVLQALRALGRKEFEHAGAPGVAEFRQTEAALIEEFVWYQWIAEEQLAEAAKAAASMAVGLYRDLAVGSDASGAERWSNPAGFARAHIGAPPDIHNPSGQDWGLPAPLPRSMREQSYKSFIDLVRVNMRHAGALRIDHAMGLQHLFWVPEGCAAKEGAYVKYPLEDLISILALESQRNRCLVIGEDLGTVPAGFRERIARANILSYRVLYFEKDYTSGAFLDASAYPRLSLAVASSHDLPTVSAWWQHEDIDLQQKIGRVDSEHSMHAALTERAKDRERLAEAIGLPHGDTADEKDVVCALHAFLARTQAAVAIAQLDDITLEREPVNVPCTRDEYPNWRRRYGMELEDLAAHSLLRPIADEMNAARPK
jgi:4-alpha-glucanotransferase